MILHAPAKATPALPTYRVLPSSSLGHGSISLSDLASFQVIRHADIDDAGAELNCVFRDGSRINLFSCADRELVTETASLLSKIFDIRMDELDQSIV